MGSPQRDTLWPAASAASDVAGESPLEGSSDIVVSNLATSLERAELPNLPLCAWAAITAKVASGRCGTGGGGGWAGLPVSKRVDVVGNTNVGN